MSRDPFSKQVLKALQGVAEVAGSARRLGHEVSINIIIADGEHKGALADFFGFLNQAAAEEDRTQEIGAYVGRAKGIDDAGNVGLIGWAMGVNGEWVSKHDHWPLEPPEE